MEENQPKYIKTVLESEFVKDGFYDKPRVEVGVSMDKGSYDKVKELAGFSRTDKISAKVVLESALRQLSGDAPNKNFVVLKN